MITMGLHVTLLSSVPLRSVHVQNREKWRNVDSDSCRGGVTIEWPNGNRVLSISVPLSYPHTHAVIRWLVTRCFQLISSGTYSNHERQQTHISVISCTLAMIRWQQSNQSTEPTSFCCANKMSVIAKSAPHWSHSSWRIPDENQIFFPSHSSPYLARRIYAGLVFRTSSTLTLRGNRYRVRVTSLAETIWMSIAVWLIEHQLW